MTKNSTVASEENDPVEENKKRQSNKAKLAEQAHEDDADKAEIARLMVSSGFCLTFTEIAGGEQQQHGREYEGNIANKGLDLQDNPVQAYSMSSLFSFRKGLFDIKQGKV